LKLYCDMNVYNRCFDDQSQLRIRLETAAIEGIFALAEEEKLTLAWSFVLDYENSMNPFEDRKEGVELLSRLCTDTIIPSPAISKLASRIIGSARVRPRDALHLAAPRRLANVAISLPAMTLSLEPFREPGLCLG